MIRTEEAIGERERLARGMLKSGMLSLLSLLPAKDSLLVLTYHRIGDLETDPWDPGIISASGDEFDEQVAYLKRNFSLVTVDEALAFVDGTEKSKTSRCRVLITFDDGYLDNYQIAFPVLRSHGAQGVFFLCSNLVGSGYVPWWDHIAYLVKSGKKKQFTLRYPFPLDVNLEAKGLRESMRSILDNYKSLENTDPDRFLRELQDAVEGKDLPSDTRRFLDWNEAKEMLEGGMAIGAHTHTHPMLSKLNTDEQRKELTQSRTILREKLGIKADTFAYPFGSRTAFTEQTQKIAEETGFRAAFSFYGTMTNQQGSLKRYDLKRVSVGSQSWPRMKVQTKICRITGTFWP